MRIYSYLFHLLLALFLLGIGFVGLISGGNLKMGFLPWEGTTLTYLLLILSLFGILTIVLAFKRIVPIMFFVWSLVVLGLMLKGFIFSSYGFADPGAFFNAICLIAAAMLACVGAWFAFRCQPERG